MDRVSAITLPRTNVVGLFSVRDDLGEEFGPMFHAANSRVAVRQYLEMAKKIPAEVIKDYSLWRLGSYDMISGEIAAAVPTRIHLDNENEEGAE